MVMEGTILGLTSEILFLRPPHTASPSKEGSVNTLYCRSPIRCIEWTLVCFSTRLLHIFCTEKYRAKAYIVERKSFVLLCPHPGIMYKVCYVRMFIRVASLQTCQAGHELTARPLRVSDADEKADQMCARVSQRRSRQIKLFAPRFKTSPTTLLSSPKSLE